MSARSQVLHALRMLGYADTARVGVRAGLPYQLAQEALEDARAAGEVLWDQSADNGGWWLTDAGKTTHEAFLAAELDATGSRGIVESALINFEPLNELVCDACTRWQLTEMHNNPTADLPQVLADLSHAAKEWAVIEERLCSYLPRFAGYHTRFLTAIQRARADPTWITGLSHDSAHRVWFELHEDLLATLGHSR